MIRPIISLVVIVLTIGFTFLYIIPAYDLNNERRGNIESLTKILETSEEIKVLIDKTKTNLSDIDSGVLSRFEVFLPEKIDPIRFANNIQSIAFRNKIVLSHFSIANNTEASSANNAINSDSVSSAQTLKDVVFTAPKNNTKETKAILDKYVSTKATLSFIAPYEVFQNFLKDLERSLGVINVTDLSFTPSSVGDPNSADIADSSVPVYQFTMTIETYSLL